MSQREPTPDELFTPILKLKPSRLPTVQINYLPKITFISFVCNFGGLLGMWLGMSFLTVLNEVVNAFDKFISMKINEKFKDNKSVPSLNLFNNQFNIFSQQDQPTNQPRLRTSPSLIIVDVQ